MRRPTGRNRLGVVGCLAIGLLTLTILVVMALIIGTLFSIWDVGQTPLPGQSIDMGGYRLHSLCLVLVAARPLK